MKICLVASDIIGPVKNGGIGTAFYSLARLLAPYHEVHILYTLGNYTENKSLEYWQEYYASIAINLHLLPDSKVVDISSCDISISYRTYHFLKDREFDIIHFHEWGGHGFFSLQAKKQGIAFLNTTLYIGLHSPTLWHLAGNLEQTLRVEDLERDYMERKSAEYADLVISPSNYMIDWCKQEGWNISDYKVLPNIMMEEALYLRSKIEKIDELVFFGRLEPRKGIKIFIGAIKRLQLKDIKIIFLGKEGVISGKQASEYIKEQLNGYNYQIITDYDKDEAIDYLKNGNKLAVIASLLENYPYTILEALYHNIPFIAADIGGIPEMVEDKSLLFSPTQPALMHKLKEALANGVNLEKTNINSKNEWLKLHEKNIDPVVKLPHAKPLVSVCITHYNRPHYLKQAVKSIEAQDYPNIELIIIDDGSDDPAALEYLSSLNHKVIMQENLYLGAARNNAARNSSGKYLLFMDDDNIANPNEVTRFVEVAEFSGADILTCVIEMFGDDIEPKISIPIGDAIMVGMFKNCFGDANGLIKKTVFDDLGGFSEDYGIGHEDWEFYAKASLAGYKHMIVPESLFLYRVTNAGMLTNTDKKENFWRVLRPYLAINQQSKQILQFAQAEHLNHIKIEIENNKLSDELKHLSSAIEEIIQSRDAMLHSRNALKESRDSLQEGVNWLGGVKMQLEQENQTLAANIQELHQEIERINLRAGGKIIDIIIRIRSKPIGNLFFKLLERLLQ